MDSALDIDRGRLEELCRRWHIAELSLFGSQARGEARADSDVDVLVTLDEAAPWSGWDMMTLRDELAALFGRPVDLVEERAVRNPYRKRAMQRDKRVIYAR